VDETELMHGFDREDTLGHVEPGDVLGERVILDEHGHQVTAREELHDQVEICRILEGVEQLDDPCRVRLGQHITLGPDMSEL
jgi:hypothetical protein